jgi:hypothetical protein
MVTPQRTLIGSRAELAQAISTALSLATRSVRCCAHDGSVFGLGSVEVTGQLAALVHSHHAAQVRVLVDDPEWLESGAPRLKALQRQLSHALLLRQASSDDPVGGDLQLIVDEHHCLHLQHSALISGELWVNNQSRARPMLADFDRRWAAASHNLPVSPLGL